MPQVFRVAGGGFRAGDRGDGAAAERGHGHRHEQQPLLHNIVQPGSLLPGRGKGLYRVHEIGREERDQHFEKHFARYKYQRQDRGLFIFPQTLRKLLYHFRIRILSLRRHRSMHCRLYI